VTLDAYLAGERIAANRVRFVKIDVEGFEFEVIRGMPLVLEARPLVVTEFSPVYMLFCLQIGFTAYAQLRFPQVSEAFTHLGVPAWFRVARVLDLSGVRR